MAEISVYRDPSRRRGRLSLINEIQKHRTTDRTAAREDQLTVIVAWLCDHSQAFARTLVREFFAGDPAACRALDDAAIVGARTHVRLPRGGGSAFRPDLSLAGSGRAFELLVEIKLDADLHLCEVNGRRLPQPDAYLEAFRALNGRGEARIRRVATLTREPPSVRQQGRRGRSRDLTWLDVHRILGELLGEPATLRSDGVELVAQDLHQYLAAQVLEPSTEPEFLDWGAGLVSRVCQRVASRIGWQPYAGLRRDAKKHFVASGVRRPGADAWIALVPAAAAYNVPGWPDGIIVTLITFDVDEHHLEDADFFQGHDRAGYRQWRALLPADELNRADDPGAQTDLAAAWVERLLRQARLAA